MDADLDTAWAKLRAATPLAWRVGSPYWHDETGAWEMYAYDPTSLAVNGKRERERIAVGPTEARCVAEMARCLTEMGEGRWPR